MVRTQQIVKTQAAPARVAQTPTVTTAPTATANTQPIVENSEAPVKQETGK